MISFLLGAGFFQRLTPTFSELSIMRAPHIDKHIVHARGHLGYCNLGNDTSACLIRSIAASTTSIALLRSAEPGALISMTTSISGSAAVRSKSGSAGQSSNSVSTGVAISLDL